MFSIPMLASAVNFPYPNSWFNGFYEPVNFDGIIYFDENIGQ